MLKLATTLSFNFYLPLTAWYDFLCMNFGYSFCHGFASVICNAFLHFHQSAYAVSSEFLRILGEYSNLVVS